MSDDATQARTPSRARRPRARAAARAGLLVLAGLLALGFGLLALALDPAPAVPARPAAAASLAADLRQWRHLLATVPGQDTRSLALEGAQLERALAHAGAMSGTRLALQAHAGTARLRVSRELRPGSGGPWLNLELQLGAGDALPRVLTGKLGQLPLPAWLANRAAPALVARAVGPHAWSAWQALQPRFGFVDAGVHLRLAGSAPDWPAAVGGDAARWKVYQARLGELAAAGRGPLQLPELMHSMAALARSRRALAPQHAAEENRAWLQVLALYVNGRVAPAVPAAPPVRRRPVLLAGRQDFPQHLLVSAALAADGSPGLADALGLAKELDDARHGSGFSFTDIAVNRAGVRLGEAARHHPERLQDRLAAGPALAAWLPRVDDLPEFLGADEFERRFGGPDGARTRALLAQIESRLDALALYR